MKEPMYKFFVDNDMAYPSPTEFGNRIKCNHPEILPLYNTFKTAAVKGTSRLPQYPVTTRELALFEHILFTMTDYKDMSVSQRCLYIERFVRRSKVYRDNLKKFGPSKLRQSLEEARAAADLKLRLYLANKKRR